MFKFKVTGFEDLTRELNRLQKRAEELDGAREVPMRELLSPEFLQLHTRGKVSSWDQWVDQSPFKIESQEDFDRIPRDQWDAYVRTSTDFSSMKDLLDSAAAAYYKAQLFGR